MAAPVVVIVEEPVEEPTDPVDPTDPDTSTDTTPTEDDTTESGGVTTKELITWVCVGGAVLIVCVLLFL